MSIGLAPAAMALAMVTPSLQTIGARRAAQDFVQGLLSMQVRVCHTSRRLDVRRMVMRTDGFEGIDDLHALHRLPGAGGQDQIVQRHHANHRATEAEHRDTANRVSHS